MVAVREDLRLKRQERTAGVDEVDARQMVLQSDLLRAQVLLHRERKVRAALDGRVVRDDHALPSLDDADPGDDAGAGRLSVVQIPCCERAQLEERGVGIDEPVDALARGELAPLTVAGKRLLASARGDLRGALSQLLDELRHPFVPRCERVVALRLRREDRHDVSLSLCAVDSRMRAASSSVSCPRRNRQRQFPVDVPGRFMRLSLPSSSTSCAGTIDSAARDA